MDAKNKSAEVYLGGESTSFERFLLWTDEKVRISSVIIDALPKNARTLLDIGAGNGTLTKLLECKFDHVTCIEPGKGLFPFLTNSLTGPKFTFHNGLVETTPLDEKFDVVLAAHSFRYIKDQKEQLARIRDCLLSTGDSVFMLVDLSPVSTFWDFYLPHEELIKHSKTDPMSYDYYLPLKEIFSMVDRHEITSTTVIPTVEDAVGILDFIYDVKMEDIPLYKLNEIRKDWTRQYGDGPVTLIFDHTLYTCK